MCSSDLYPTRDGLLSLGASNLRQQKRLWTVLGHPEMAKTNNDQRHDDRAKEYKLLTELLAARTADEWETHLEAHGVPAARVRTLPEAIADPQLKTREFLHKHENAAGVEGAFTVPSTPFKLAHGGGRVTTPPPPVGHDTDAVLGELGYDKAAIARLRAASVV